MRSAASPRRAQRTQSVAFHHRLLSIRPKQPSGKSRYGQQFPLFVAWLEKLCVLRVLCGSGNFNFCGTLKKLEKQSAKPSDSTRSGASPRRAQRTQGVAFHDRLLAIRPGQPSGKFSSGQQFPFFSALLEKLRVLRVLCGSSFQIHSKDRAMPRLPNRFPLSLPAGISRSLVT